MAVELFTSLWYDLPEWSERQIQNLQEVLLLEQIIKYIQQKYNPLSVILYGSYANGTNNLNSDFDALVISSDHEQFHDTSFVNGIQLDVFIYPSSYFEQDFDCKDFVQIFDGQIVVDSEDIGKNLKANVQAYLQARPTKTSAEIQANVDWCVKMFERVKRSDCEGLFRWHWVLIDSLEIFCDIMNQPYFGPKKALKWMEKTCPDAFNCYKKALHDFDIESLEDWIVYIRDINKK